MKIATLLLACLVILSFSSASFAAEYWVIKENGKLIIVEKKPANPDIIVQGPFTSRSEAEVIVSRPAGSVQVTPGEPRPAARPLPAPPAPPAPPGR
jgi:hypothetical protein